MSGSGILLLSAIFLMVAAVTITELVRRSLKHSVDLMRETTVSEDRVREIITEMTGAC